MADEREAVAIEREVLSFPPAVADYDPVRVLPAAGAHIKGTGPARRGERLLARIQKIVDRGLDRFERSFQVGDLNHGASLGQMRWPCVSSQLEDRLALRWTQRSPTMLKGA